MFSGALAPFFEVVTNQRQFQQIASFLLLFFVSAVLVDLIGFLIRRSFHISSAFGLVDRIAGLGAGIAKGTLILSLIVYPLAFFPEMQKDLAKKSRAAPELVEISEYIMVVLAPGFASTMEKAGIKLKSLAPRTKSAAKYRKQIEEVKIGIQNKAEQIKNRLNFAIGSEGKSGGDKGKKAGSPESEIDESDRKALEKLIKKLE